MNYEKPKIIRLMDCSAIYDCCHCGGIEGGCGCPNCFDCHACDNCQTGDESLQCLNVSDSTWKKYVLYGKE